MLIAIIMYSFPAYDLPSYIKYAKVGTIIAMMRIIMIMDETILLFFLL